MEDLWPLFFLMIDDGHAFPISPVLTSPHHCAGSVEPIELDQSRFQRWSAIQNVWRPCSIMVLTLCDHSILYMLYQLLRSQEGPILGLYLAVDHHHWETAENNSYSILVIACSGLHLLLVAWNGKGALRDRL